MSTSPSAPGAALPHDPYNRRANRYLAVVCAVTLVSWAGAKLGCNARSARTPEPRPLPTATFQRSAKSAAMELQHRWVTGEREAALELAGGPLREQLRGDLESASGEALPAEQAFSRAELLERPEPISARVRVQTFVGGRVRASAVLEARMQGHSWRVVGRTVEALPAEP